MNRLRGKRLIAWSLAIVAPLGLYMAQASFAGDGQSPLIDKDFESSLRKFVSKRFYNRIDATGEQRQQLEAIWTGTMEQTRPEREQLRHGLLDLSTLLASDTATDEQIKEKAHALRALHEKINDERLDSVIKARKVLTPEQRQKIQGRFQDRLTGGAAGFRARHLSMLLEQ